MNAICPPFAVLGGPIVFTGRIGPNEDSLLSEADSQRQVSFRSSQVAQGSSGFACAGISLRSFGRTDSLSDESVA